MMKRNLILCAALLVCAAVCGQQRPKASAYHYQKASLFEILPVTSKDIVFLGNSITDGCEWAELFGNPRIKNRGISADKTWNVLERLDPIVKGHPRKVFLMIGINDLPTGETPEAVVLRIRQIADRFLRDSPRTELYIQSVLPVNDNFPNYAKRHASKGAEILKINEGLRLLCGELGLTYVDLHSALKDSEGKLDERYTNDGLHLLGEGYLVWKAQIEPYVK